MWLEANESGGTCRQKGGPPESPGRLRFAAVLSLLWGALKAREKHLGLAFKSLQSLGGGR